MQRFLIASAIVLWLLGFMGPEEADAQRPTSRSLRELSPRVPDELDRPRRTHRSSHRGWEVRRGHFVVVATTTPAAAEKAWQELDATWQRIGRLADTWSKAHRQPDFAIGAVGVLISNIPINPRSQRASGPRALNHGSDILINVASGQPSLDEQLPLLRREATRAFLRVTGQDAVSPDWVIDGLAMYFERDEPFALALATDDAAERRNLFSVPPDRFGDPLIGRNAAWLGAPKSEGGDPLWLPFLLTADDARNAPALISALAATARADLPIPPGALPPLRTAESRRWLERGLDPDSRFQMQRLAGGADDRRAYDEWRRDPLAGQPILDAAEIDDPRLLDEARRMALILKLARRFGAGAPALRSAAVSTWTGQQQHLETAADASGQTLDLSVLYRRLTDPSAEPWATIDTDGTLLWSHDRARIDELFGGNDTRYATYTRRGRSVLQARLQSGAVLEASLDPNKENPSRPIARVQTVNHYSKRAAARN